LEARVKLDIATRDVSAFRDFADLMYSVKTNGYVPTLILGDDNDQAYNDNILAVRAAVLRAGGKVFPAELAPEMSDTEVLRVPLTALAIDKFVDTVSTWEGEWEAADREAMVVGKTFVRATRRLLREAGIAMAESIDEHGELAATSMGCQTPEQADFAERSARRSVLIAAKRIELAVAGQRQPSKVHVGRVTTSTGTARAYGRDFARS
jgi:hypothetical protein